MPNDYELGLQTLLLVRTELGIDLEEDLLKACFDIQKKYQFNHDRTLSTQAMDRLIEQHVEKSVDKHTGGGA
ncbi:MAG: hypothetical protein NXH83_15885 [Rhodobacteraceae bacterium]|jgi:hypothetical protein|uniref:Uncharacterized protein n=1 Tax=Jiella sonneratiae TaxID=2816856 RepID=A0ABS3JA44_9HYPH|nr:DNA modification system-associated small protein [Jiella sonneratiae]MBO0906543.1 hypothetical protein [Jiella sonneratiae]MCR9151651.1 hypothetical protein [Paracoccaceae bacterium]